MLGRKFTAIVLLMAIIVQPANTLYIQYVPEPIVNILINYLVNTYVVPMIGPVLKLLEVDSIFFKGATGVIQGTNLVVGGLMYQAAGVQAALRNDMGTAVNNYRAVKNIGKNAINKAANAVIGGLAEQPAGVQTALGKSVDTAFNSYRVVKDIGKNSINKTSNAVIGGLAEQEAGVHTALSKGISATVGNILKF